MSGQVLGSPNFMPPEQAAAKHGKVGRYSDVYALGGILYHLLTARPPFQADLLEVIVSQVLTAEPVSPRMLNPAVPRDLETICLKCLEKEPSRRYATAHAVLPVPVWSAAFAFAPDGKRFIALDKRDGSASLWETATVRPLEKLSFLGTNNSAVKWSPDGRTLAVGDWLGNLRIWDLASRRIITNFVNEGAHVGTIRFAGGGRSLFCGVEANTPGFPRSVKVWNVADWREVRLPAEGLQNLKWAAMSPDNRTFAALDADGTVALWDLASGRGLAQFQHHFASVGGYMAFSPDGRTLAGSATEGLTTLWDVATGRVLATVRGNVRAVHGVAFSPDGQRLISGGADATDVVRLMDLASQRYVATLPGEPDEFWFLEMSPDGNTLVAVGFHPHRAVGRPRDHCDPGRAAVARFGQGQALGAVDPVREQPQTAPTRLADVCRGPQGPARAQLGHRTGG